MSEHGRNLVYECGHWQVDLGRRELQTRGVAVPIGARAFEIIETLVRSANELVTKNDLMDRIWPGATVGETTLHVHISAIRKAFGQDRDMLKTASGRGYRLVGNWTPRPPNAANEFGCFLAHARPQRSCVEQLPSVRRTPYRTRRRRPTRARSCLRISGGDTDGPGRHR